MFRQIAIAMLLVPGLTASAQAEGKSLSEQRFDVAIRDQNVRDVYQEISAAIGVPILASDAVQGRVSASFEAATATDMLNGIADDRALDWRFDGQRIRVTARSEQTTRIVDLDGVRLDELSSALTSLGVYNDRFQMTAVDREFAMIVAPPDYVAIVEVVLGALVERHAEARATQDEDDRARRALSARAAEQRLEFARLERAAAFERTRLEQQRLRAVQHERELRARRGPVLIRNGIWGG